VVVVAVPTSSSVDRVVVSPLMAPAIESANDVVVEEAVMLPPVDFDTDGERRDVSAVLENNAPPVVVLSVSLMRPLRATVSVSPATASVDALEASVVVVASVVTSAVMTTSSVGSTVNVVVALVVTMPPIASESESDSVGAPAVCVTVPPVLSATGVATVGEGRVGCVVSAVPKRPVPNVNSPVRSSEPTVSPVDAEATETGVACAVTVVDSAIHPLAWYYGRED